MRGSISEDQLLFDPELERTCRKLNSKSRRRRKLAKERRERGEASTSTILFNQDIVEVMEENTPRGLLYPKICPPISSTFSSLQDPWSSRSS